MNPTTITLGQDTPPAVTPEDIAFFEALRAREFSRLAARGQAYLDYTGSGLYGSSQIEWHRDWLADRILGNPHSENPASLESTGEVEKVKERVLAFFGADPAEYDLVFTANASAAIKLVGEAFPFEKGSRFVLSTDNHNSIGGIRDYARRKGAEIAFLPLTDDLRMEAPLEHLGEGGSAPSLLAFPAQSNFSGVKHHHDLVAAGHERGFRVMLDTAAYAPTNRLDLGKVGADYACISFYKMFGYPTGLGALIARREALEILDRPWYAGGTVDFVSIQNDVYRLRKAGGGFEDGTPHFLGIVGVAPGLDLLEEVGMDRMQRWVRHLTSKLLDRLVAMKLPGGKPAVELYGPTDTVDRGGTVAFNLLDESGRPVPYEAVEAAAGKVGVSLRGGCFCNPGAAEVAFKMPPRETLDCLEELQDDFSLSRFRDCLGGDVPVGAVRASLGVANSEADIDRVIEVLEGLTGV